MHDRDLQLAGRIGLGSIFITVLVTLYGCVVAQVSGASPYQLGGNYMFARQMLGYAKLALTCASLCFLALSSANCAKLAFACIAALVLYVIPSSSSVSVVKAVVSTGVPVVVFAVLVFRNRGWMRRVLLAFLAAYGTTFVSVMLFTVPILVASPSRHRPVSQILIWVSSFMAVAINLLLTAAYVALAFGERKPGVETESARPASSVPLHWRVFAASVPLIAIVGVPYIRADYFVALAIMPSGLMSLVWPGRLNGLALIVGLAVGWIAYIAVDIAILRSKNWRRLMLGIAALAVLLLANVAGCAKMITGSLPK